MPVIAGGPFSFERVNVAGSRNVVAAARDAEVRVLLGADALDQLVGGRAHARRIVRMRASPDASLEAIDRELPACEDLVRNRKACAPEIGGA